MQSTDPIGIAVKNVVIFAHSCLHFIRVPIKNSSSLPLALVLALAYLFTIAYASLQPFSGWRLPPFASYRFLFAPWPQYITLEDVLINALAYLPLGFMFTFGLRGRLSALPCVISGFLLATIVSILMETTQLFITSRVASNIDILANAIGSLFGALSAPLFLPSHVLGSRLIAWRHQHFYNEKLINLGIILITLWVLTHLNPLTQLFGCGDLKLNGYGPFNLVHTAGLRLFAEAMISFFNLLGIGLLLSVLMPPSPYRRQAVMMTFSAALLVKVIIIHALPGPHDLFAGFTPGVCLGFICGIFILILLFHIHLSWRLGLGLACWIGALTAINLAPDNPYTNLPHQLFQGKSSHLLSFSNILQALSALWPLLAMGYLTLLWIHRSELQKST